MKQSVKNKLEQNREYLVREYLAGKSTVALGKELKCSNASIYVFLRDYCKIPIRITQNKHDKAKIKEMMLAGKLLNDISIELNVPRASLSRYAKEFGIETITKFKKYKGKLSDRTEQILRLYNEGLGCDRLSRAIGCSTHAAMNIVKKNNIKIRGARRNFMKEDFFEKIDLEEKAYFLGLLLGDGSVDKYNRSMSISMIDKEIILKLKLYTEYTGEIQGVPEKLMESGYLSKMQFRLRLCSKKICEDLIKNGCVHNKTFDLKWPTLEQVPENLIPALLRGMMDADGTYGWYKHGPSIAVLATQHFLEGMQNYLIKNDIKSGICVPYEGAKVRKLAISRNHSSMEKFIHLIYGGSTVYLQRKYDKAQEILQKIQAKSKESV